MSATPALRPTAELAARDPRLAEGHGLAVRQMFARISPTYDRLNHLLSFGIDRRWRERAIQVLHESAPSGPWLDSCAGTLDLAAAIQARSPAQRLIAGDFARGMLQQGRAKLRAPARAVVCDAQQLPFAGHRFAGVICGFGMRNLAAPERGVAEAYRVLGAGGVFVVLEFFRPARLLSRVFHAVYGRTLLPLVGRLVSGDGEAYGYLSRSMRGFLTRREFEQLLVQVGFREVRGRDLSFGVASIVWGVK